MKSEKQNCGEYEQDLKGTLGCTWYIALLVQVSFWSPAVGTACSCTSFVVMWANTFVRAEIYREN